MSRRIAIAAFAALGLAACHHSEPSAQTPASTAAAAPASPAAASQTTGGAMPVGSIKEDKGDIRYVNPTMQVASKTDGGAVRSSH